MAERELNTIIDSKAQREIVSVLSDIPAPVHVLASGSEIPTSSRVVKPIANQVDDGPLFEDFDMTNQVIRIGIGIPAQRPDDGTFTLSWGGYTTTPLPHSASDTVVAAALNDLTSIQAAGGVTVTTGTPGVWKIRFVDPGARTAFTVDTTDIYPNTTGYVVVDREGDVGTREIVLLFLEVDAAAYSELATPLADGSAAVDVTQPGDAETSTPQIQTITFTGQPYAGYFIIGREEGPSGSVKIPYDAVAADVRAAILNQYGDLSPNLSVTGAWPLFTVTMPTTNGETTYPVSVLTVDTSNLIFPVGRKGVLDLRGPAVLELLDGKESIRAKLEYVLYDTVTGSKWPVAQIPITLVKSLLPTVPGVTPPFESSDDYVAARAVLHDRAQGLDADHKAQARSNLGLGSAALATTGTAAGNVPVLDGSGKIPAALIPALDLVNIVTVTNSAARLALSAAVAANAIVVQSDNGQSYGLIQGGDSATDADWIQIGDRAISFADVPGLQDALDAKAAAVVITSGPVNPQTIDKNGFYYLDINPSYPNLDINLAGYPQINFVLIRVSQDFGSGNVTIEGLTIESGASVLYVRDAFGGWFRINLDVTSSADPDTIVLRDGNGGFEAGACGFSSNVPDVAAVKAYNAAVGTAAARAYTITSGAIFTGYNTTEELVVFNVDDFGNITTGVWQGALIQPQYGGLGMDNHTLVADRFPYTSATGTFTVGTITAAGRALIDDADAAAQRTTLGLSTLATTTPGTGVATFLGTPTSANLRAALTDESGTGALLFAGGNIGSATGTSLALSAGSGTVPITLTKSAGTDDYLRFIDSSASTWLAFDSTKQLNFAAGANGPIYFGCFGSPSTGRGGFSFPNFVMLGMDTTTKRLGMGADSTSSAWFALNAPAALLEVRGKANEIQLIVQGYTTQTSKLTEWRNSSSTVLASVDGAGAGAFSGLTSTLTTNATALIITSANTSTDTVQIKGSSASSYASIGFLDSTGAQKGSFGYGNSSAGSYVSTIFFQAGSGVPFALGAGGSERMRISAAGGVSVGTTTDPGAGNLLVNGVIRHAVYTVATLPAAPGNGARAAVTDSNATTAAGLGNTVAAGGANFTPVYWDGSNWKIG